MGTMKLNEKSEADLQFRRKQPFASGVGNSEPVVQRRKSTLASDRRHCSDSSLRVFRFACSIAAAGNQESKGGYVATISSKWTSAMANSGCSREAAIGQQKLVTAEVQ